MVYTAAVQHAVSPLLLQTLHHDVPYSAPWSYTYGKANLVSSSCGPSVCSDVSRSIRVQSIPAAGEHAGPTLSITNRENASTLSLVFACPKSIDKFLSINGPLAHTIVHTVGSPMKKSALPQILTPIQCMAGRHCRAILTFLHHCWRSLLVFRMELVQQFTVRYDHDTQAPSSPTTCSCEQWIRKVISIVLYL